MFEKVVDRSKAMPLAPLSFPGTASLTRGMHDVEIGGATPTGASSYSGGKWTVKGAGDPRHPDQSCHFTYQALKGDCAIIAKVESIEDPGENAKAGVMLRASLDPGAPRGLMAINKKSQAEQNFQGLSIYGGAYYATKALGINQTSYWVKLERFGKILAGYISPDGTNWAATDVGQFKEMPETVYIGLMVCSGNKGSLNSTTFSNVQITGGDGRAPVAIPAPPAAVLASPGEKSVILRWQPSFGADCYWVKRAPTSGGPYKALAKARGTSYVDTSATSGGNYYYVVTAANSVGESANSPEDTVNPPRDQAPPSVFGSPEPAPHQ
jgi:regulation of enolase protein 1 (concanavalin A-like superfamily)